MWIRCLAQKADFFFFFFSVHPFTWVWDGSHSSKSFSRIYQGSLFFSSANTHPFLSGSRVIECRCWRRQMKIVRHAWPVFCEWPPVIFQAWQSMNMHQSVVCACISCEYISKARVYTIVHARKRVTWMYRMHTNIIWESIFIEWHLYDHTKLGEGCACLSLVTIMHHHTPTPTGPNIPFSHSFTCTRTKQKL